MAYIKTESTTGFLSTVSNILSTVGSSHPFIITDRDFNVITANGPAKDFIMITEGEPLSYTFAGNNNEQEFYTQIKTRGNAQTFVQVNNQDIKLTVTPISNEQKNVEGYLHLFSLPEIITQDVFQITALYESFIDNSPIIAWIIDENGLFHYVNQAYRKQFKLDNDPVGRNISELFEQGNAQKWQNSNLLVLQTRKAMDTIEMFHTPGRNDTMFRVCRFPVSYHNKILIGGWAMEITEVSKLLESLSGSLTRLDYAAEAASQAVYDYNVVSDIIHRGKGFYTLFGYNDISVSFEGLLAAIHPSDAYRVKKIILDCLADPQCKKWNIEYRYRDAYNKFRFVVDKGIIMRESGKPIRVVGGLQDISEYKIAQEELLKSEKIRNKAVMHSLIEKQEKIRRDLSVNLRDSINQTLSASKLLLEMAKENEERMQSLQKKSYENLEKVISEIKSISESLNPSAIEDIGLVEALNELLHTLQNHYGLKLQLKASHGEQQSLFKTDDRIAVYRIVQDTIEMNHIHSKVKSIIIHIDFLYPHIQINALVNTYGVTTDITSSLEWLDIRNRVEFYNGQITWDASRKAKRILMDLNFQ